MIGTIEDHALFGQAIDRRCLQGRLGIVDFQIEGRLVISNDEEDVRSFGSRGCEESA